MFSWVISEQKYLMYLISRMIVGTALKHILFYNIFITETHTDDEFWNSRTRNLSQIKSAKLWNNQISSCENQYFYSLNIRNYGRNTMKIQ